jgi:hypothetical protein
MSAEGRMVRLAHYRPSETFEGPIGPAPLIGAENGWKAARRFTAPHRQVRHGSRLRRHRVVLPNS